MTDAIWKRPIRIVSDRDAARAETVYVATARTVHPWRTESGHLCDEMAKIRVVPDGQDFDVDEFRAEALVSFEATVRELVFERDAGTVTSGWTSPRPIHEVK